MSKESALLKLIGERYSVRSYADRPIEQEKLDIVLEAARLAPSASNAQPWHFYVVKDPAKRRELVSKTPIGSPLAVNSFLAEAPVVIVATAGPVDLLRRIASFLVNKRWYYIDLGIALEHMVLTAWELGLGSCWVGWFNEAKIKQLLAIPAGEEVVALLALGYAGAPRPPFAKNRKKIEEIVKVIG